MTWIATAIGGLTAGQGIAIGAGLGLLGSSQQADAARYGANLQSQAAAAAQAQQQANLDRINAQQAPQRSIGYSSLNQIAGMLPGQQQQYDAQGNVTGTTQGTGYLTQIFGPEQLKSNLAPNYQFMLDQGLKAQNQSMNVGGGGSNIGRAGIKFAEDYASNAYQNAVNNFTTQQTGIYNRLANIAGIGQTGQAQTNAAGIGATNAMGQLNVGAAGAQAGGAVGAANAMAGGLQGIGNAGYLASLMRPSGYGGYGGSGISSSDMSNLSNQATSNLIGGYPL